MQDRKTIKEAHFISESPFLLACIDSFFSEQIFINARKFFEKKTLYNDSWEKTDDTIQSSGKAGRKKYLTYGGGHDGESSDLIKRFFEGSSAWDEIFSIFDSQKLANEITKMSPSGSLPFRPIKIRPANYKAGFLASFLYTNCYINYKLSRYPPGSGISLHRDHPQKLIAFLLYFGFSDGKDREDGGTQFYKYTRNTRFDDKSVDHFVSNIADYKLFLDIAPKPNRLAFFCRTKDSWHGVKSLKSEDANKITRDNLQVNYMHCNKSMLFSGSMRLAHYMIKALTFITDYLKSFYIMLIESLRYSDPILEKSSNIKANSSLGQLAWTCLPSGAFQLVRDLFLFFKGGNFFLDSRRRLIRETVLKYSTKPRKGIIKAANYLYDCDVEKSSKALCFGVYDDLRFELFLANQFKLSVLAADPTPIAIETFNSSRTNRRITFKPIAISTRSGMQKFYFDSEDSDAKTFEGSLQNINNTSKFVEVDCKTLEEFKHIFGIKDGENYILKMNIKGGAIEILEQLFSNSSECLDWPTQIMVEFELPKFNYDKANYRIAGLLGSLYQYYDIFYVSSMVRYSNYDFLLVRK